MASNAVLTEKEYWRILVLIRGDVQVAIKSNRTLLTLSRLVRTDRELGNKINLFSDFWHLHAESLQTTFFITFSRLFDSRRNTISITTLLDATVANPHLFTKSALRLRKQGIATTVESDPNWFEPCVNAAWEPNKADLAHFKKAVEPHHNKFTAIFQPIRNSFYAHRGTESDPEIIARFQKTNINEAEEILRFLHTMLWSLQELLLEGRKHDLRDFANYQDLTQKIDRETEKFIRWLP